LTTAAFEILRVEDSRAVNSGNGDGSSGIVIIEGERANHQQQKRQQHKKKLQRQT